MCVEVRARWNCTTVIRVLVNARVSSQVFGLILNARPIHSLAKQTNAVLTNLPRADTTSQFCTHTHTHTRVLCRDTQIQSKYLRERERERDLFFINSSICSLLWFSMPRSIHYTVYINVVFCCTARVFIKHHFDSCVTCLITHYLFSYTT